MSSKLLRPHAQEKQTRVHRWTNAGLARVADAYQRALAVSLGHSWLVGGLFLLAGALAFGLFKLVPSELAPAEDRGAFFVSIEGPEGAGFDYTVGQIREVEKIFAKRVGEGGAIRRYNTRAPGGWGASEEMHSGNVIVFLQDWDKRDQTTAEVADSLRAELGALPGVRASPRVGGGLVGSRGQPVQIVLGGPE